MSDIAQHSSSSVPSATGEFAGLAPLFAILFFGFLAVGEPLGALSLYVHDGLGFNNFTVGWVIGVQSLATVLTRHRAGALCDRRGPKTAVLAGLPLGAAAGALYLASALAPLGADARLAILVAGRLVLSLSESLFITGAMSWGIARLGPARTGKVMSWQGVAMYAALGLGAPLGLAAQALYGFVAVALLAIASPLIAVVVALILPGAPAAGADRAPFHRVLRLIWRPGVVLTLSTIPFASMAAFLALDYSARAWSGAGLALGAFGACFILVRLVGASLPDRLGGVTVACVSLAIVTLGQALLWLAPAPGLAFLGAAVTGGGVSLVFPAMGVEATRRITPGQRGQAVGNFMAFADLAIGVTGPALGLLTSHFGYASAFLAGAAAALAALLMAPGVRRMNAGR